jgi:hypothetical protein
MIAVDRAVIINLKRRPDRLAVLQGKLAACSWPFPQPEVFEAIEGNTVGVPADFKQGGGAFGCRQSHVFVLSRALMDRVGSVLVIEDDADILTDFGQQWAQFAPLVPDDWEGIMLGGQHHKAPDVVSAGLVHVTYAQRTHAYIARGRYLRELCRRWAQVTVHIDWVMRDWQHQYRVYAPARWVIGQAGGKSDICGRVQSPQWWNQDGGSRKESPYVCLLKAPRPVMEGLRGQGFHGGNWRDKTTDLDNGLIKIYGTGADPVPGLRDWCAAIAREAASFSGTVTIWHPLATIDQARAANPDKTVIQIDAGDVETALHLWSEATANAPVV